MKGVSSPQPSSGLDQVHSLDNSTIKLFTEIGLAKIQSNFQDIMSKTNQTQASFVSLHQRAVLGACFAPKKKSAQASYLFHLFCNVKSKKWWRPSQARVLPEKKAQTPQPDSSLWAVHVFLGPKLQDFFSAQPDFCSSLTTTLQILRCSNYK